MKKIKTQTKHLLILIFIISNHFAFGQTTGSVSGQVVCNKTPLEFATVTLSTIAAANKTIKHTTTDSAGHFVFDKILLGEYFVKISLIGYSSATQKISLTSAHADLQSLSIQLAADTNQLQTVNVTTQKKLVEKTPQGFVINAAANLTQAGGTATDLLKNAPTVVVDAEGGITLRGKLPLILINGRNSKLNNPDQIPASSIESIEIINNPGAKYDANAESGVINIKLKKNKQNGTNGSVALGVGAGAKGRISSSVLLNNKTKKWNFGLGYDNRFASRTRAINGSRTNFYLPDTYLLNQNRNDKRFEQLQNLKGNVDFTPNDKTSFSFEAIGSLEGQDNDESLNSLLYKQNKIFNANTDRHSLEIARGKVAELAFEYNQKFADERTNLTINLSTSLNYDRENTNITTQALTETRANMGNADLGRTHNYEDGNISTLQIDYTFPVSASGQIETGYKLVVRHIKADFETADFINNQYVVNTGASNIFTFNEQVHALYAQYNAFLGDKENPSWKYAIGLRAEQVVNDGNTQNNNANFSNQYLKFFPTADLTYFLHAGEFLKLSYGKRINRPSLGQLNPFVDITDALSPHSGNPNLNPEIIDALELGYNKEWQTISFSTNLFYRYASNTIRQFSKLQPNGANLTLPLNIGNATTYGLENVATIRFNKQYDVNASLSMFQQKLNGSNIAVDALQDAFGWNAKMLNNIVPWQGGKLQIIANYNSALVTPQGKRVEQYYIDLGFQQKLGKNGNTRIGLTIVDIANTLQNGTENNTIDFSSYRYGKADTRAIMLTFGFSFKSTFKEKLMDNPFSKE
jgi:outer membrane receptor protein involved in Fe transport